MLQGELYNIVSSKCDGPASSFTIELNPDSIIYKAHFKGMPITPGICLLAIATELVGKPLVGAKEVKFLAPVEPGSVTVLEYSVNAQDLSSVDVKVSHDETVYAKMTLSF